ncbi:MAG TPA: exodeoxyribonuclease VII large subunit [Polyangiaceae bacterium]|nr:exodeoxyribonuclease VII large subunit [Polyangiaceae bacterium]
MAGERDAQIYSVADLGRRLKRAVEGATAEVWVEGEISSAKPAPSGHVYFCLKDEREDAIIECVMYRSAPVRSRHLIADGRRVQLRGRATVWAPRGRLQFVGDLARPAGRGELLLALDALKNKLLAEGLFAPEKKRALPSHPAVVGVVTSSSGAAIHDIAKVAFRRGGVRIVLSATVVQGQNAAAHVIRAIARLECMRDLDVIIVGRGGGSAEDLMVFNEEAVVRRVAACRVPVVSAVGHEVDVTLTDMAADARAATPSQAAEMVVPDARAAVHAIRHLAARLGRAMHAHLAEDHATLARLRATFAHFRMTLSEHEQRMDDMVARLEQAVRRVHGRRRTEVERLRRRLAARHPRAVIARSRATLGPLEVRCESAIRARVDGDRSRFAERAGRLSAMSPLAVLSRGYAIATTDDGRAIRSADEVTPGETITIRVHRGVVAASVESVHGDENEGDGDSLPVPSMAHPAEESVSLEEHS